MLTPWRDWESCLPQVALAGGWDSSTDWAQDFKRTVLDKMKTTFKKKGVMWMERVNEILYVHLLDQSHAAARFRWHRDTEEDTADMRVKFTLVVLLKKNGSVAGMRVAGAPASCQYKAVGTGYLFDAGLFHSTEEVDPCDCLKVGIFVGMRV